MSKRKIVARVAFLVVGVATLAAVVYIMVRRLGLNPDLDFGAGLIIMPTSRNSKNA